MGGSAFNPRLERTLEQPQGQSFNNRYLDKVGIDEQGQNPFVRHRDQPEVDDRLKVGLIDRLTEGLCLPASTWQVAGDRVGRLWKLASTQLRPGMLYRLDLRRENPGEAAESSEPPAFRRGECQASPPGGNHERVGL